MLSQKIWQIRNPDPQLQVLLSNELGVHPIIAQLLINRGINSLSEAEDFLGTELARLHDPFLLKDMDKAVARLQLAKSRNEQVLIFGDYDVDGVTSSALMHNLLTHFGLKVTNHIPHRMTDGYGMNENIVKLALKNSVDLVMTVDCGITSVREVELLNQQGIDVIILDHHEPSEAGLPPAVAVVDPKRPDCSYPFKYLAAVGLVAKLSQALLGHVREEDLDLIALGTIADVVQLRGENRIFVKHGLPRLGQTKNKGLAALIEVAKLKDKPFRPHYVGFILGPRINATGRIGSAQKSLDLLLCQDKDAAYDLAQFLEGLNTERQRLQRDVVEQAIDQIEQEVNFKDHKVIVLSKEGWHKGVLGIVASKITEMYYRPTVVISMNDGVGTASARSIEGFHLHEALSHCAGILENFGGHKQAAGLTIRQENVDRFRQLINDFAQGVLQVRNLTPTVNIDCEIPLSALSVDLVEKVDTLEPYGEGNPFPVFCSRQLTVKSAAVVLGKETLKFWVSDGQTSVSAVGFGMGKYRNYITPGQKLDLAYELIIDDWNKEPTVQLKLKDIKESGC